MVKVSQHMGLVGIIFTIAASLVFKCLGSSSMVLPVLLSILVINSLNLQAM